MKHAYTLISLLSFLLFHSSAFADHILGAELLYEHISGNTYKITLAMYGECSGGAFGSLKNAEPKVNMLSEEGAFFTLVLHEDINARKEVSNVCPADAGKTTCKSPQGTIPGVTRFLYTATTQLLPSAKWRMLFAGHMDNSGKSQTGLSDLISNVRNNSGFGIHLYLEAVLNNLKEANSSPQYSTIPTPFYCVNIPQQYNQGATDPDYDELKFRLVPPIDLNGIVTTYTTPYSATKPFATQAGNFYYDSSTGQMSFTPAKAEVALIINEVEEYRNGELVGSSMRGMTFFLMSNCNNQAPYGNIDAASVVGGLLHNNTINMCDGQHKVIFDIPVEDSNYDTVHVALSNIPPGANVSINGNGTKSPVIHFSWDMTNVVHGTYTFYANYNDGACPVPGNQVMAYSVTVAKPFSVIHEVLAQTDCIRKQYIEFHLDGGILPRKITVTDDANKVVASYTDNSGSVKDSFKTGAYTLLLYADNLPCSTTYNFNVADYGIYPYPPAFKDISQCLFETPDTLDILPSQGGQVNWYDISGNPLAQKPVYSTDSVMNYRWLLNQTVGLCPSVYDTLDVGVHAYPDIQIVNNGGHVCVGDGVYLTATGGIKYEWQPAEKIVYYDNLPYVYVYGPETFTVTGYNEFNCGSRDTLVYDNIEQCCLFSYPNVFSPNGDGNNDGWHPITYGNVDFYLLSIYNRWGQRIFTSSDPKEKWDGRFGGSLCDIGTYHYLLRAKCITGHEEKGSGSFILLR